MKKENLWSRCSVMQGSSGCAPCSFTVGATVLDLSFGGRRGPLWQPLCYAQIGGLVIATLITLLLVPVFYTIAVLDLKIVKWEGLFRPEASGDDSRQQP